MESQFETECIFTGKFLCSRIPEHEICTILQINHFLTGDNEDDLEDALRNMKYQVASGFFAVFFYILENFIRVLNFFFEPEDFLVEIDLRTVKNCKKQSKSAKFSACGGLK